MPWKRKTVDDQKRKFVARATQGEKSLGAHCAENTGAAGRPDTSCWNGTGTGRACRTDHTRRFAGRSGPPGRRSCGSWMYGMRIQPGVPGRFSDIYWTRVRTAFRRPVRSATFSSGTAASARPRHPQTQGKDERFHRTLKEDLSCADLWPIWKRRSGSSTCSAAAMRAARSAEAGCSGKALCAEQPEVHRDSA